MAPTPGDLVRDVGHRIAQLRREAGLTQEQVAERLGIPPRAYQLIEYGGRNLTLRSLATLAAALGVEPAAFFVAPAPHERRRGRPRRSAP